MRPPLHSTTTERCKRPTPSAPGATAGSKMYSRRAGCLLKRLRDFRKTREIRKPDSLLLWYSPPSMATPPVGLGLEQPSAMVAKWGILVKQIKTGRSIPAVHMHGVHVDRVQFPAAR